MAVFETFYKVLVGKFHYPDLCPDFRTLKSKNAGRAQQFTDPYIKSGCEWVFQFGILFLFFRLSQWSFHPIIMCFHRDQSFKQNPLFSLWTTLISTNRKHIWLEFLINFTINCLYNAWYSPQLNPIEYFFQRSSL